jgi:7-cyano-7-deazaguanine synthase
MSKILLLSGGLDSTALAAFLIPEYCITIDYGQRAACAEIGASKKICAELGLKHDVLHIAVPQLGVGDMSNSPSSSLSKHSEFWPFRNQFLITVGAMYAAKHNYNSVLIGSVSTDKRHKDGTKEFLEAINATVSMQEGGISVLAPALEMTTNELITKSKIPLSILAWAHSCHTSNIACGQCPGCNKHSSIMRQIGWVR